MSSFAFIPKELFEEETKQDYLPLSHSKRKRIAIFTEQIDCYDVVGVADEQDREEVSRLFALVRSSAKNQGENIFAEVTDQRLYIVVADGGKLRLANIFSISKEEDVIYFTLSAIECTDLEANRAKLRLKLDSSLYPTLLEKLNKYVETIISE